MTELTTTIVAVTIYPNRVRLTRRGLVKLKAGTHAIEIPGLPLSLNPDSLRASVYGSASARLLGVQVKRIFYSDKPSFPAWINLPTNPAPNSASPSVVI